MPGYKTELREEEKEKIIKEFLPFIKYTANRLSWRLPPQLTVDDLISAGLMGLLDAIEKYDQGKSKLKTYAEVRIKGSMLDELRAFEWLPRSLKQKINNMKNVHRQIEGQLGRPPEDEEIAEALHIPLDEYYQLLQDANGTISFRFEDIGWNGSSEDGLNVMDCISDPSAISPLSMMEDTAQKAMLAKRIDELPEKERLLLSLYYYEELTMKEIAKVMKLTEGRICQLHSQALIRLKAKLEPARESKRASARCRYGFS